MDHAPAPASGLPSLVADPQNGLTKAWVVPEGDIVIVAGSVAGTPRFTRFQHQSDDTWLQISDLGIAANFGFTMGGLTAGPTPHLIRYDSNADFQEVIDDGSNTWATNVMPSYSRAELGVGNVLTNPYLSADGLRMTFIGSPPGANSPQAVYYTDRPTIADRFRAAEVLPGVPLEAEAFLDPTCARVYLEALGSIFFEQRI